MRISIKDGTALALVEGGHWIANRNPDRYNHEVGKFLKECRISLQSVF